MAKYLRRKMDGLVYDWNPLLAEDTAVVETFETDSKIPDYIPDLQAFLRADANPPPPSAGVSLSDIVKGKVD